MRGRAARTPAGTESKRCAIYTRKSTTMGLEQEFNSLDAQREACTAYMGRQPGWTVVDESYDDGGFTGANIDRPAFQRLLLDVEARKIDIVLVYKVDRLSRSLLDFAKVMERFGASGVSFVSVTQQFSTADAMGRLTLNMLLSFAEFEREMIGERTRDKIAASRRRGKWTGGFAPFGYDAKDKHLVVNTLEAMVVREAFELLLQHRHMALVARLLNERGMFPRTPRSGARVLPPRWTKDSIARILKSPLYAGFMVYGAELHAGEHTAIIESSVWQKAKLILEGAARNLRLYGINPDYVLRGLVRCGGCGGRMCPGSTRKAKREHRYYRCSNRDKRGTCKARALPANAIEAFVVERLAIAASVPSLAEDAKAALDARIRARRAKLEEQRAALPTRIAAWSATVAKYVEELTRLEGKARQILESKLETVGEALAREEKLLAAVKRDLVKVDMDEAEGAWVVGTLAQFPVLWEALTMVNRGRLLRALVDHVVVDVGGENVEMHLVDFGDDPGARSAGSATPVAAE